jgi:hypothetical protein
MYIYIYIYIYSSIQKSGVDRVRNILEYSALPTLENLYLAKASDSRTLLVIHTIHLHNVGVDELREGH